MSLTKFHTRVGKELVDDTVTEIVNGSITIKDGGITNDKLAADASRIGDFNTIEELKSFDVTSIGDNISTNVLGYYTEGDGGGGTFFWDADSIEDDNAGTIIEATDVTTGRWKRVYSDAVNVRWFGAKGDGSTNDQPAIQAAIDCGTRVLEFSSGVFNVTNAITFPVNREVKVYEGAQFSGSAKLTFYSNIHATDYAHIFDDIPVALKHESCEYVSVCWFGAKGDAGVTDNSPLFRNTINSSIDVGKVYIPPSASGYWCNSPVNIFSTQSNNFQSWHVFGNKSRYGSNSGTSVYANFDEGPLLSLRKGRHCKISSMNISGKNSQGDFHTTLSDHNSYHHPDAGTGQFNLYAGLAFDGLDDNGEIVTDVANVNSGSQLTEVDDVFVSGFVVGIAVSASGGNQNDTIRISNSRIKYCGTGMSLGNSQNRACVVTDSHISNTHTAISNNRPGGLFDGGGNAQFRTYNLQVINSYQVLNCSGGVGGAGHFSLYAEAIGRLGTFSGATSSNSPYNFVDCHIKTNNAFDVALYDIESENCILSFDGCIFKGITDDKTERFLRIGNDNNSVISFKHCTILGYKQGVTANFLNGVAFDQCKGNFYDVDAAQIENPISLIGGECAKVSPFVNYKKGVTNLTTHSAAYQAGEITKILKSNDAYQVYTLTNPSSVTERYYFIKYIRVINGGTGYAETDEITLNSSGTTQCIVKVSEVDSNGAITGLTITERGKLDPTTAPTKTLGQSSTTGSGVGSLFNVSYRHEYILVDANNDLSLDDLIPAIGDGLRSLSFYVSAKNNDGTQKTVTSLGEVDTISWAGSAQRLLYFPYKRTLITTPIFADFDGTTTGSNVSNIEKLSVDDVVRFAHTPDARRKIIAIDVVNKTITLNTAASSCNGVAIFDYYVNSGSTEDKAVYRGDWYRCDNNTHSTGADSGKGFESIIDTDGFDSLIPTTGNQTKQLYILQSFIPANSGSGTDYAGGRCCSLAGDRIFYLRLATNCVKGDMLCVRAGGSFAVESNTGTFNVHAIAETAGIGGGFVKARAFTTVITNT